MPNPMLQMLSGWRRRELLKAAGKLKVPFNLDSEIPTSFMDLPVVRKALARGGVPVAARYERAGPKNPARIAVDPESFGPTHERYLKGEYRVPVDKVGGLGDPRKFLEFLLNHEGSHHLRARREGETFVAYENRMNQHAAAGMQSAPSTISPRSAQSLQGEKALSERVGVANKEDRKFQRAERGAKIAAPLVVKPPMAPVGPEKVGPGIVKLLQSPRGQSMHPGLVKMLVQAAKTGKPPAKLKEALVAEGLISAGPGLVERRLGKVETGQFREVEQKLQLEKAGAEGYQGPMRDRISGESDPMYFKRQRRLMRVSQLLKGLPVPLEGKTGAIEKMLADDPSLVLKMGKMTPRERHFELGKLVGDTTVMGMAQHQAGRPVTALKGVEKPVPEADLFGQDERAKTRTSQERPKTPFYNYLMAKYVPPKWDDADVATGGLPVSKGGFSQSDIGNQADTGDIYQNRLKSEGPPVGGAHPDVVLMQQQSGRSGMPRESTQWSPDNTKGLLEEGKRLDAAFRELFTKTGKKTGTGNDEFAAYKVKDKGFESLIRESADRLGDPVRLAPRKGGGGAAPGRGLSDIEGKDPLHFMFQPVKGGVEGVGKDTKAVVTDQVIGPYLTFLALHAPEKGSVVAKSMPLFVTAARNRMEFLQGENVKGKFKFVNGKRVQVKPPLPEHLQRMGQEAIDLLQTNPAMGWELFRAVGTARVNLGTAEFMERRVRAAMEEVTKRARSGQHHQVIGRDYPDEGVVVGSKVVPSSLVDTKKVRSGAARSELTGYDARTNKSKALPGEGDPVRRFLSMLDRQQRQPAD